MYRSASILLKGLLLSMVFLCLGVSGLWAEGHGNPAKGIPAHGNPAKKNPAKGIAAQGKPMQEKPAPMNPAPANSAPSNSAPSNSAHGNPAPSNSAPANSAQGKLSTAGNLQQRIDFGNAQILGQSIKSGAVYLMHRKKSDIKSMLEMRKHYREEIKEDFDLEQTAISQSAAEPKKEPKQ